MRLVRTHKFTDHRGKWRITIPLQDGRECPRCLATVCGWMARRAHTEEHEDADARLNEIVAAVSQLAAALERAGLVTVRERGGEDLDDDGGAVEAPPLSGYVLGSGELPAGMRGGGE